MAQHHSNLREWRAHRAMTQGQVLDRLAIMDDGNLPRTGASLSRLENGKQPYSQRILEALASIYQTEPGHLINRNPKKEGDVIDLVARMDDRQRQQALAVLEAIAQTAS